MSAMNELDRVLGEWLDEGPRRAPDRPIELAVDHARAHPRRRDPLGWLRPDPMAPPRRSFGGRPVLLLAAIGLLLAALVAVGVGGPRDPAVVPPVSASPSAPSPSATPAAPQRFEVDLEVPAGQPQSVTVMDASGLVIEARSGSPSEGMSFPDDSVVVTNLDATTLQLGWSGFPCATTHTLEIEATGRAATLTRPPCTGETDAIAIDRILVLRFSAPIDAGDMPVTLVP
jgi:hypothetical protein